MASVAIQRAELCTGDQDEAVHYTETVFATGTRPRIRAAQRTGAELRIRSAATDQVATEHARCELNFAIDMEPFDYPAAFQVLHGWVRVTSTAHDARFGPGDVCLNPLGVPMTIEWQDLTISSMRVSLALVAEVAAERTGLDPASFHFTSPRSVSLAAAAHWRRVAGFVFRELMDPDTALTNPIAADQLARTAAAADLVAFPNSTMNLAYRPEPGQVAPAAVRRAIAYIEAHADQPVTMTDIAGAARVGPRALQYAFRRHYDTTPTAYLRRVRLARAHQDLVAADPTTGATVATIVARWGFTQPSRFATLYRRVYAQPPSHTLRS